MYYLANVNNKIIIIIIMAVNNGIPYLIVSSKNPTMDLGGDHGGSSPCFYPHLQTRVDGLPNQEVLSLGILEIIIPNSSL